MTINIKGGWQPKHLEMAEASSKRLKRSARFKIATANMAKTLASIYPGWLTLCVSDPQAGKSTQQVMLAYAYKRLKKIKRLGVIHLTNSARDTLFVQNNKSWPDKTLGLEEWDDGPFCNKEFATNFVDEEEGLYVCGIMISGGAYWSADRSRILDAARALAAVGCTRCLIIIDEVHLATKPLSQLDRMFTDLQVEFPQTLTDIVGYTATPEIFFSKPTTANINVVHLEPGITYKGLQHFIDTGRLLEFGGFRTTDFYRLVPRKPGHVIFRVSAKESDADIEAINTLAKLKGAQVRIYTQGNEKGIRPISRLLDDLAQPPGKKVYYDIIKGALSAGDDLTLNGINRKANITAWFEGRMKSSEAVVQSICRAAGYTDDDYPIYVTEDAAKAIMKHMEMMDDIRDGIVPNLSRRVSSTRLERDYELVPCTESTYADWLNTYVQSRKKGAARQLISPRHKEGGPSLYRNLLAGSGVRGAVWGLYDFTVAPTDREELKAFRALKKKFNINKYAHGASIKTTRIKHASIFTKEEE